MKYLVFAAIIAAAHASSSEEDVDIKPVQFNPMGPMNPMQMFPGMMPGMGGMPGMNRMPSNPNPYMYFGGQQRFPIDYNMGCSNNCGCQRQCVPWQPCQCRCPPPCPPPCSPPCNDPETPGVETPPVSRCVNGAPDQAFPDCCFNLGRGSFCCTNGANNRYCCLNGADNPWCSPVTEPPVEGPGSPDSPGGCPCQCQPCIPWMPCQPCSCPCG